MVEKIKDLILSLRGAFMFLALSIGILMLSITGDYGVIDDVGAHLPHGKRLLDYFHGSYNVKSPEINPFPLKKEGERPMEAGLRFLNFYGGFFDLASSFIYYDVLSPSTSTLHVTYSEYWDPNAEKFPVPLGLCELRTVLNAVFGFLTMFFCGLVAKELGSWKTGIIALFFVVLTPSLFGHSFNNPKDIPEAAFYIISVYAMLRFVKNLPKINFLGVVSVVLPISLAINVRISGLVLIPCFVCYVLGHWLLENLRRPFVKQRLTDGAILAAKVGAIGILAYLAASIFWPFGHTNPLLVPYLTLTNALNPGDTAPSIIVHGGGGVYTAHLPWHFALQNLLILNTPLHIMLGVLAIPFCFIPKISKCPRKNLEPFIFVFLTFLIPLLLVMVQHRPLYDRCRHLYFVLPPLISCAAVAIHSLISSLKNRKVMFAAYGVVGLLLLEPAIWMIKYHPLQAVYFSPVVGGTKGALGKYEVDYWGFVVKPAVDWLAKNAENATPQKPARVRQAYSNQLKAQYYIAQHPNLAYAYDPIGGYAYASNWDYAIVMHRETYFYLVPKWPPPNTVHVITAGGAPLCAIVKRSNKKRPPPPAPSDTAGLEQLLAANPSANGYVNLSMAYYNNGDFINCILACRKALSLNPSDVIAYNNMCSAYNNLAMFKEAVIAGKKGLKLAPDSALLKNNLKIAVDGVKAGAGPKSAAEYFALSFKYYQLGDYEASIKQGKQALMLDNNNSTIYNNICSAYNILGKYSEAVAACEQALRLAPDFTLAKNNLKVAQKALNP